MIFRKKVAGGAIAVDPADLSTIEDIGEAASKLVFKDGRETIVEGEAIGLGIGWAAAVGVEPLIFGDDDEDGGDDDNHPDEGGVPSL